MRQRTGAAAEVAADTAIEDHINIDEILTNINTALQKQSYQEFKDTLDDRVMATARLPDDRNADRTELEVLLDLPLVANRLMLTTTVDTLGNLLRDCLISPEYFAKQTALTICLPKGDGPILNLTVKKKRATLKQMCKQISLDSAKSVFSYCLDTLLYSLESAAALARFIRGVRQSPPTKRLFAHLGPIIKNDFLPIVGIQIAYHLVWRLCLNDVNLSPEAWSAYMGLLALRFCLFIVPFAAQSWYRSSMLTDTTILSWQHYDAFYLPSRAKHIKTDSKELHPICKQAGCNNKRFIKGEVKTTIVFFMTLLAIAAVSRIPAVGTAIAFYLTAQQYGETTLEYFLGDARMCDRHRTVYFQENSELSLALGLLLALAAYGIGTLFDWNNWLGLPNGTLDLEIKAIVGLLVLALPYHMHSLPKAVHKSTRWPTPLSVFRRGVGGTMDLMVDGVKKCTRSRLKEAKADDSLLMDIIDIINDALQSGSFESLHQRLPVKFRSLKNFRESSVAKDYIPSIAANIDDVLEQIDDTQYDGKIQALLKMPLKVSASVISAKFGCPRFLGKLIVKCLKSKEFFDQLRGFRLAIRPLVPNKAFELRGAAGTTVRPRRRQYTIELRRHTPAISHQPSAPPPEERIHVAPQSFDASMDARFSARQAATLTSFDESMDARLAARQASTQATGQPTILRRRRTTASVDDGRGDESLGYDMLSAGLRRS